MKFLLLFPALALFLFSGQHLDYGTRVKPGPVDTSVIHHILDGSIKEWPAEKIITDGETGLPYGIDNDNQNLYLVLEVPSFRTQMKMMRTGMDLYIDLKGKKKEGRGIEFPVKNADNYSGIEDYATGRSEDASNDQQKKPDLKAIRMRMAINLVELKLFGFGDGPVEQQLKLPNSANIAFAWDSSNVMYIEYQIPLSMLGDASSLNKKEIDLGWKINAVQMQTRENTGSSEESSTGGGEQSGGGGGGYSGRGSGGRGGGGYGGRGGGRSGGYSRGGNSSGQSGRGNMMQEEKFWTKYTIAL